MDRAKYSNKFFFDNLSVCRSENFLSCTPTDCGWPVCYHCLFLGADLLRHRPVPPALRRRYGLQGRGPQLQHPDARRLGRRDAPACYDAFPRFPAAGAHRDQPSAHRVRNKAPWRDAQHRAWRFWQDDPADIAFADAVLADVAKRFPVDQSQIYISGFSFGAAMAWRYACARGDRIAGLMTMSGTIKQASTCANPPRQVRHVHGLNDLWMSLPRGPDHDATNVVALWRKALRCGAGRLDGALTLAPGVEFAHFTWDNCAGNRSVTLDIHTGGHFIPTGWLGYQLDGLMPKTAG